MTRQTTIPTLDPRQRYSINEAAALLRVCRAQVYRDIAAGRLESFTDGRRRYVPGRAIIARSAPPEAASERAA